LIQSIITPRLCLWHTSIIKWNCCPQFKDSVLLNKRYLIEANKQLFNILNETNGINCSGTSDI
jgi:hypothetical protein